MQTNNYEIDTPENVVFDYEISSLGSRFLAAVLDHLTLAILLFIIYLVTIAFLVTSSGQPIAEWLGDWLVAVYFLMTFAVLWGYYIFFELIWNGQSLGKRWLGLRVIRTDGMPVTLVESIVRNLVRAVDFLPLYYGLGVVVMLISAQSRRLGDLAAGTLVVKERRGVTLASLAQAAAPAVVHHPELIVALGDPAAWPLGRLSQDEMYAVKEFLARRSNLINRASLALRLAARLSAQLELASPATPQAAETLLEQLAALR